VAGCRAIVELRVPAATLSTLGRDLTRLGAWAEVVADLVRQLEGGTVGEDRYVVDPNWRTPGLCYAATWRSATGPAP
jgi:hypothetical protein